MVSYSRFRPAMSRLDPSRFASAIVVSLWTSVPCRWHGQGWSDGSAHGDHHCASPERTGLSDFFCGLARSCRSCRSVLLDVESVHRGGEAAGEDLLDGVGRLGAQRRAARSLGAREIGQHVVGRVAARRRPPDAEADAHEVGAAELGDHRPHAVVAAVPAARAQLQTPERQIQIVVDDEDLLGRESSRTSRPGRRPGR